MIRQPGSIVHIRNIIRKSIYKLKWKFGFPIDIYKDTLTEYDPRTGRQTIGTSKLHIDRAIIFPGTKHRDIFQTISFIKANSNFITGGDIELEDRVVIVDARDLPRNYIININDYFLWDHERYDIKTVQNLESDTGYYLTCRKVINSHVREILDEKIISKLVLRSTFTESVISA